MEAKGHQRFFSSLTDTTDAESGDPKRFISSGEIEDEEDSDASYICIEVNRPIFSPPVKAPYMLRSTTSEIEEEDDSGPSHTGGYGTQQSISSGSEYEGEAFTDEHSNATGEVHRSISSGTEEEEEEDISYSVKSYITANYEIEDAESADEFSSVNNSEYQSSVFSLDVKRATEDSVYVAVGNSESSIDALAWTLAHYVNLSTNIYLIHVFPEIRYIPSPLGLLPRDNVKPAIVQKYMAQEREKRRALLQKFLDACYYFKTQNKVDAVLVESDEVAKTILNLIPFLNITKLVLGSSKTKKLKFRKNGVAHQIFKNAPLTCEVKLICKGNAVVNPTFATPSISPSPSQRSLTSQLSLRSLSDAFKIFNIKET
ncbi:hypothetical protein SLE2022_368230 [Rubroshorea leprosula]